MHFNKYFSTAIIVLLSINCGVYAQEVMDTNPASVKWRQINTEGFKIIYPEGSEEKANIVANNLEQLREPVTRTMGGKLPKKIPIILQANNSISNGFVTLGPRRSELFTQPPQDYNFIGTNKWMTLLTAHEYRHIAQFSRSKTGFNKFFYYLFGQNTQAAMAVVSTPRWFWEGDATLMETVVTQSGRGRIPSFDRVFRSNLLEGKRFNYNKQHLQSFKDFVPDHYRLGYFMNVHLRKRTKNAQIWDEVTKSSFGVPFIPFTFSNALKRHTDHFLVKNYEMMMDEMHEVWSNQIADLEPTSFNQINKRESKAFTDYATPQYLEDGSIVVYRTGISDIGQLVRLDHDGKEMDRFTTGVMNSTGMLSAVQYKIYWNEYEYDPRWGAKTYSVIKCYDFSTKKFNRITKKSRYSGVSVSPDGYKLVTTLNTPEGESYLVLLDAISGKEIKRITNEPDYEYAMATWASDGKDIVALKIGDKGKSVIKINVESGTETSIIDFGNENIGNPLLYKKMLFYSSPFNGIDNIYAYDLMSNEKFQVTRSKYGAYSPAISANGDRILYADHTVDGLNVVEIHRNTSEWIPLDKVKDRNINLIEEIVEQEGLSELMQHIPEKEYQSKKYSKLGHMFNLHSWGPFISNDINTVQAGIFSKDVLSTTRSSIGYTYDVIEESGYASAKLSYQGFFPVFDYQFDYGSRKSNSYQWDETTNTVGLSIPLNFTNSKYVKNLTIANSIGVREISNFKNIDDGTTDRNVYDDVNLEDQNGNVVDIITIYQIDNQQLDKGRMVFNDFALTFSNLLKRSKRNIRSQWGQYLLLKHLETIAGEYSGSTIGARGILYFPSPINLIFKNTFVNHSLNFRFGYQIRSVSSELNNYTFRNIVFKPRGFSYPTEKSFETLMVNYEFPLLYPDLSLGPFVFIKRVKANMFFDYGRDEIAQYLYTTEAFSDGQNDYLPNDVIRSRTFSNDYISFGSEITFDFNLMRFPIDIEMGVRMVHTNAINQSNPGGTSIELLIGAINF